MESTNHSFKVIHRLYAFLGFGLIMFALSGCGLASFVKEVKEKSGKPTIVKSNDGQYELTIPGGWKKETKLHDEANIQASRAFEELYVVVISENKKDFADGTTLNDYTQIVREGMLGRIESAAMTDSTSVVVGKNPAMRFETHGVVEKIKAGYINTTVETRDAFHQVIAWTLDSRFEQNRAKLLEVVNTFKESGTDSSVPPPPARKK